MLKQLLGSGWLLPGVTLLCGLAACAKSPTSQGGTGGMHVGSGSGGSSSGSGGAGADAGPYCRRKKSACLYGCIGESEWLMF